MHNLSVEFPLACCIRIFTFPKSVIPAYFKRESKGDVRTGPPTRSTWLRVVVSIVEPTIKTFGGDDLGINSIF